MVIGLRKQSGMGVAELSAVSGVHPTTIKTWLTRARREGEGSLGEKRRGRPVGTHRKLKMTDEMWLRDRIVGSTPQQMKLPLALWSRPAIRALIAERFGIEMQNRLVGKYLKRWGFTPQR
ncbi:winged helix-turn-helix domain-containing protein, partial [Accumulibacter sp.]|uniref:winged helix-turn-helix domain-containing protein n=1 Tax=Accumulibacter sp. TaxID=2053492 RepID=UPI0026044229